MRVWVDCTAAAHPLVLRPIIERLASAGHEVEVTARDYGQTVGILERLGIADEVVGRTAAAATAGKGARARAPQRGARALGAAEALRPRARPRLGRPRGRRRAAAGPVRADAGLRVRRACSASSAAAPRAG